MSGLRHQKEKSLLFFSQQGREKMDSRNFLAFSLSLILIFPPISSASIRFIPRWSSSSREGAVIKQKTSASSLVIDPTRVTQLSWTPRVFLYKGLLTDEECDHFINLAKGKLEKSMVADNDSGKSVESEVRTSSGMFLSKRQDDIVANVEAKLAAWTFLPEENGESMQILHYENGQKYEPHFDFFHDQVNQQLGGHRIATVLMYLSNVKKGGETVFPMWKGATAQPKDDSWTQCAKQGYAVKPMKGDALLFFNLHPNATTDPSSLHGSCPVVEGEKWSATRWIHVKSFERPVSRTTGCVDENESCEKWAKAGECKKNPVYMVGSETDQGYCRKSCKACSS
ncbi:probable prolyl 4-hydroxylase 7 isoform X2 [Brassica rapa]|uniref:probable prolyl 4-hydroxylase 7 isoform X2 n=1 Tax=Brassica campestris TaxID=3711 RepID=UPI00142DE079|nr:probable prolyl 4-hydroxylase 7 isoform X2 [Brassica rapa]